MKIKQLWVATLFLFCGWRHWNMIGRLLQWLRIEWDLPVELSGRNGWHLFKFKKLKCFKLYRQCFDMTEVVNKNLQLVCAFQKKKGCLIKKLYNYCCGFVQLPKTKPKHHARQHFTLLRGQFSNVSQTRFQFYYFFGNTKAQWIYLWYLTGCFPGRYTRQQPNPASGPSEDPKLGCRL